MPEIEEQGSRRHQPLPLFNARTVGETKEQCVKRFEEYYSRVKQVLHCMLDQIDELPENETTVLNYPHRINPTDDIVVAYGDDYNRNCILVGSAAEGKEPSLERIFKDGGHRTPYFISDKVKGEHGVPSWSSSTYDHRFYVRCGTKEECLFVKKFFESKVDYNRVLDDMEEKYARD